MDRLSGGAARPEQGAAGRLCAPGGQGVRAKYSDAAARGGGRGHRRARSHRRVADRGARRRRAVLRAHRRHRASARAQAGRARRCRRSRSTRRGRKLPNNWVMGQTPGIAVDRRDHVWILHRPRTVPEDKRSRAAPAVLEFDEKGKFVNGVGRAGHGLRLARQRARHLRRLQGQRLDWRQQPDVAVADAALRRHAAEVHQQGEVPAADRRPRQEPGQRRHRRASTSRPMRSCMRRRTSCSSPTATATAASSCSTPTPARSSGCGARSARRRSMPPPPPARGAAPGARASCGSRADAGQRGAPLDTEAPAPPQFGGPVHGVKVSNDGWSTSPIGRTGASRCSRSDGKYLTQMFINRAGPPSSSVAGTGVLARSRAAVPLCRGLRQLARAGGRSEDAQVLYQFGDLRRRAPGEFRGPHHLAVDSKGNLYMVEVRARQPRAAVRVQGARPRRCRRTR